MSKKKVEVKKEGWDWNKLIMGAKRPAIAFIGYWLSRLAVEPQWAWVGGIGAERIYGTIEYYVKRWWSNR